MQPHKITPSNSSKEIQDKDTSSEELNPLFELDKYNIGVDDFKKDIIQLTNPESLLTGTQTNCFPIEVFPIPVQQIIKATNADLNFPIDFIGASMLFATSIAIGNTHRVEVKKGWTESAVIYLAIVAPPGTNKSHPLSFAIAPIAERDKKAYHIYEQKIKEYEAFKSQMKKNSNQQDVDEPVKPIWQKSLLSDFTPEALNEVHKFNKRGIGIYVDELAGWFKNFNRYNTGSEMEFWLSAWSGKAINIDRKRDNSIFIPLPFISVAGTIQNGVLNELAKNSRTQNGFTDRILFVVPDNIKKEYWSETELNPEIIESWHNIISNLLDLPIQNDETFTPKPDVLKFTTEAKQMLFDWQRNNADQCNNANSAQVTGIYSKLEMYAVRFALILELMQYACNKGNKLAISIESIKGAIKLVEYFKISGLKIHSIIANVNDITTDSRLDKLPNDKKMLYKALPTIFTTEEGFRVAENLNIPERTYKRFISEKELFSKPSRGKYQKLI